MLVWCVYIIVFLEFLFKSYRLICTPIIFISPAKLAAEGLNVVLISRTPAKLEKVANEIS